MCVVVASVVTAGFGEWHHLSVQTFQAQDCAAWLSCPQPGVFLLWVCLDGVFGRTRGPSGLPEEARTRRAGSA